MIELLTILFTIVYNYVVAIRNVFIPPKNKSIAGQVVLVTGGGRGIGRELALQLAALEARLVIWDIIRDNVDNVVGEIKAAGGWAWGDVCDVTSPEEVAEKAAAVRKAAGQVDILVNNAGILHGGSLVDLKPQDIRRTFDVNTLAHFWTVKEFLPHMMAQQRGHILNVVSMSAFSGTALLVDYSASKYAALGFCESLREELQVAGYKDIHISALCPYFVTTGLVKQFTDRMGNARGPKETAEIAIDGMLKNEEVILSPKKMWWTLKVGQLFPRKTNQFLKLKTGNAIYDQYAKKD